MKPTKPNLIVILGPTASGKTKLAAQLANTLKTDIISADSRQVYKYMNIGTGKDYDDYVVNNQTIHYHLIDIIEPGQKYNVSQFMHDFFEVFHQLNQPNKTPILCGGTGLYIQSVLSNFEYTNVPVNEKIRAELITQTHENLIAHFNDLPQNAFTHKADISTHKRTIRAIEIATFITTNSYTPPNNPTISPLIIGINPSIKTRNKRIDFRLAQRLQQGMIAEVEMLLQKGVTHEDLVYYGLEYKFISEYIRNMISITELEKKLCIAIHQYAKRQMTYFRKMEKDGFTINWIDGELTTQQQTEIALQIIGQAK
jgi:tRNA dimethylallyltransferase